MLQEIETARTTTLREIAWMLATPIDPSTVKSRHFDVISLRGSFSENQENENPIRALARKIHPSYQATFGETWGEGAVSIDDPNMIIDIRHFLSLTSERQKKFKLFYEPTDFATRFEEELLLDGGIGFIAVAETNEDKIVGAAWGVRAPLRKVLERIGKANYSSTDTKREQWTRIHPSLLKRTEEIFRDKGLPNAIPVYWDEIYTIPSLHKSGVGMQLMSELLSSIISSIPVTESLPLLFRTSLNSGMGSIASALSRLGVLEKVEIEGDDPDIVYFAGSIPALLLNVARLATPSRVFRAMLQKSRSARIAE